MTARASMASSDFEVASVWCELCLRRWLVLTRVGSELKRTGADAWRLRVC